MGRFAACHVALVAAVVAAGGCSGFKMAGSAPRGTAGTSMGGAGGSGGTGGNGGSGGGGASGRGGTGGSTPIIIIDAAATDGPVNPNPDANCGARSKTAMKLAPDVLILLDRSGSMNDNSNNQMCQPDGGAGAGMGCGASSKWAQVAPAIMQVVSETEADVNWGLKFFPDNNASVCGVSSTTAVDIGPGNASAIATAIMGATQTNGGVMGYNGTPTRNAENGATTYLQTLTDTSPKYILLATDGLPTCPASGAGGGPGGGGAQSDDSVAAPSAVDAARTAGFKTFVVGISTGGGTADATLSKMAEAGGLARTGTTPSYYPVSNTSDLAAAIRTLIGVAATCTFQIGPNPTTDGTTGLDHIDVLGDGSLISRDTTHANGYDYVDSTMQSIQVYGSLCDQIMSGAIKDVTVTFRCLVP